MLQLVIVLITIRDEIYASACSCIDFSVEMQRIVFARRPNRNRWGERCRPQDADGRAARNYSHAKMPSPAPTSANRPAPHNSHRRRVRAVIEANAMAIWSDVTETASLMWGRSAWRDSASASSDLRSNASA